MARARSCPMVPAPISPMRNESVGMVGSFPIAGLYTLTDPEGHRMRDSMRIYVNGRRYDVQGEQGFSSLSNFLRCDLGLTGTKTSCFEGGCGSCSVLVGRVRDDRLQYRP